MNRLIWRWLYCKARDSYRAALGPTIEYTNRTCLQARAKARVN